MQEEWEKNNNIGIEKQAYLINNSGTSFQNDKFETKQTATTVLNIKINKLRF